MNSVTITTGSRLHFGLLTKCASLPRMFGGCGMMIDQPGYCVRLSRADRDQILATDAAAARIETVLDQYRKSNQPRSECNRFHIEVTQAIPSHCGLGSGTQLSLAVMQCLALLCCEPNRSIRELALRSGRCKRSAIGLYGFEQGGFIVDGGKTEENQIGTLISRTRIPAEWCCVLVTPTDETGLSGQSEIAAFDRLPNMEPSLIDQLSRIVLLQMTPALHEADFATFSEAVYQYGALVGDCFAAVQGGRYLGKQMPSLVDYVRKCGIAGVGQSSWGPTIFLLCEQRHQAEQVVADLQSDKRWDCEYCISRPLNHGAVIEFD